MKSRELLFETLLNPLIHFLKMKRISLPDLKEIKKLKTLKSVRLISFVIDTEQHLKNQLLK